jgi:biopolymer transport protein ExbD
MALRVKKELNCELSLTSFIDLLSTIVCFLLVSSAWVQVSSMDLKQSEGTEGGAAKETASLDVDYKGPGKAVLRLKMAGKPIKDLSLAEPENKALVKKVNLAVISFKQLPALKNSKIESVLIGAHKEVTHGEMVAMLDGLRIHGFSNIGVKPN